MSIMDSFFRAQVEALKGAAIEVAITAICSFLVATTVWLMGAHGFGCICLWIIVNVWYWYQLYSRFNKWQASEVPKNHIVINVKGGEPIKIEKPGYVQMLTLGGCVASLVVALLISNHVKNQYLIESKSEVDRKRNALVAKRWVAFKEMAIFCGLFPLTLMKDMDAITTLISYVVKSYKDAVVIHKMWQNITTFFEGDEIETSVKIESMSHDQIMEALAPLIRKEVEAGMAKESDKIAEKVLSSIELADDESKSQSLVPQMDKPKSESDDLEPLTPLSDISELPDATLIENDVNIDSLQVGDQMNVNEEKYIIPHPDNDTATPSMEYKEIPPSDQMKMIQDVISRSQTTRHGLGYKGSGRAKLLTKVDSIGSWFRSKFEYSCIKVVSWYIMFREWKYAKRTIVIGVSLGVLSVIGALIYKFWTPSQKSLEGGGKMSKADRQVKYVKTVMRNVFKRYGGKAPKEVYDEVKEGVERLVKADKFTDEEIERRAYDDLFHRMDEGRVSRARDKDNVGVSNMDRKGNFVMGNGTRVDRYGNQLVEASVNTDSISSVVVKPKTSEASTNTVESKNNKGVKPRKFLIRRKVNWKEKLEKAISDSIKPEHLVMGSAICKTPQLYCIEGVDDKNQTCYSTIFPIHHMIVACRHGISGMKKLNVIIGGNKMVVQQNKAVIGKDVIDQVFIPKGSLPLPNNVFEFREPVEGELATFFFVLKDGQLRHVPGMVGQKTFITSNNERIIVYEWTKSSVEGSCGGVYIAGSDNKIIGFHGVGSPNSRVKPMFYPATEQWLHNLDATAKNPSFEFGNEVNYVTNYTNFINGNDLKAEVISSLNLPGRQN